MSTTSLAYINVEEHELHYKLLRGDQAPHPIPKGDQGLHSTKETHFDSLVTSSLDHYPKLITKMRVGMFTNL